MLSGFKSQLSGLCRLLQGIFTIHCTPTPLKASQIDFPITKVPRGGLVCEDIGLSTTPSQTWRDPRMTSAGQPSSRMRNLIGDGNRLWTSCVLRTRKLQCNGVQPCHGVSRWSPTMTSLEIDQPRVVVVDNYSESQYLISEPCGGTISNATHRPHRFSGMIFLQQKAQTFCHEQMHSTLVMATWLDEHGFPD